MNFVPDSVKILGSGGWCFFLFDHVAYILYSTLLIVLGSSWDYEESTEELNLSNSLICRE
jgi:hypothetical protein